VVSASLTVLKSRTSNKHIVKHTMEERRTEMRKYITFSFSDSISTAQGPIQIWPEMRASNVCMDSIANKKGDCQQSMSFGSNRHSSHDVSKPRYRNDYNNYSNVMLMPFMEELRHGLEELVASCHLLRNHAGGCYHGEAAVVELLGLHALPLCGILWLETEWVEAKAFVRLDCPKAFIR